MIDRIGQFWAFAVPFARTLRAALFIARFSVVAAALALLFFSVPAQTIDYLGARADAFDFWHGVASVLGVAVAAIYASGSIWYWARVALYVFPAEPPTRRDGMVAIGTAGIVAWTPRILGTAPLVALAIGFYRADAMAWALGSAIGAAILLVLFEWRGWLLGVLGWTFRPPRPVGANERHLPINDLPRGCKRATTLTILFSVVCGIVAVAAPVAVPTFVGADILTLIWFGNVVAIGTFVACFGAIRRVPILGLLVLMALIGAVWFRPESNRILVAEGVQGELATLPNAFDQWMQGRSGDRTAPYPVVLVSAEGGGIRAAYFTAMVLARLQDLHPDFARHIFVGSGVSGGSLGLAVFAALLADGARTPVRQRACRADGFDPRSYQARACEILSADLLGPPVARLLYVDSLRYPLWGTLRLLGVRDRGHLLEVAIEDAWTSGLEWLGPNPFQQSFTALWQSSSAERPVPNLIFNTTNVETGSPAVISNLDLCNSDQFPRLATVAAISGGINLRLSAAVGISARFPIVTSSSAVPRAPLPADLPKTSCLRGLGMPDADTARFIDGGYYENSGTELLPWITRAVAGQSGGRAVHFILLRIENGDARTLAQVGTRQSSDQQAPREQQAQPQPPSQPQLQPQPRQPERDGRSNAGGSALGPWNADSFQIAIDPLRGVMNAREARGYVQRSRAADLACYLGASGGSVAGVSEVAIQIRPDEQASDIGLPLGWALSHDGRREINRLIAGGRRPEDGGVAPKNPELIGRIIALLRQPPAPGSFTCPNRIAIE